MAGTNVSSFIILLSGEGLTSFSISITVLTFLVKKKMLKRSFPGCFFLEHSQKLQVKSRIRTRSRLQI